MSDSFHRPGGLPAASLRAAQQGVSDNIQSVAEMRLELELLRRVVRTLIFTQVRGEPLALNEEPIRSWLGLPADTTPEQAMERLLRTQARVVGTSACPTCGAQNQDLEGVTNEQCPWCGAALAPRG